jgi:hypothetical protein
MPQPPVRLPESNRNAYAYFVALYMDMDLSTQSQAADWKIVLEKVTRLQKTDSAQAAALLKKLQNNPDIREAINSMPGSGYTASVVEITMPVIDVIESVAKNHLVMAHFVEQSIAQARAEGVIATIDEKKHMVSVHNVRGFSYSVMGMLFLEAWKQNIGEIFGFPVVRPARVLYPDQEKTSQVPADCMPPHLRGHANVTVTHSPPGRSQR